MSLIGDQAGRGCQPSGYRPQLSVAVERRSFCHNGVCTTEETIFSPRGRKAGPVGRVRPMRVQSDSDSESDCEIGVCEEEIVFTSGHLQTQSQRMVPPSLATQVISKFTSDGSADGALALFEGQSVVPADYELWFRDYPDLMAAFKDYVEKNAQV